MLIDDADKVEKLRSVAVLEVVAEQRLVDDIAHAQLKLLFQSLRKKDRLPESARSCRTAFSRHSSLSTVSSSHQPID